MLAGSITAAKLVGTDIATVGTITAGTWQGTGVALGFGGCGGTTAATCATNIGLGTANTPTFAGMTNSGNEAITGTTLPAQAAGTLGLGGEAATPTTSANGEADIFITSTTGGITLQGKGSVSDFTLNNSAGSAACTLGTGATAFSCGSFLPTGSTAPTVGMALPAAGRLGLYGTTIELFSGASDIIDYGVTTASVLTLNNATTINSATFKVTTLGVATAVDTVCYSSVTGLFTEEPTGTTCTVSDERKKTAIQPISLRHSLDIIMASTPITYYYKPEAELDDVSHLGFGAQTLARIAPELVTLGDDGVPNAVKQIELIPIAWAAIKQLKGDNDNMLKRIEKLEAMRASRRRAR